MSTKKKAHFATPRYSGNASRKFWKRINSLPEAQQEKLYTLGVILQNVEGDILRQMEVSRKRES